LKTKKRKILKLMRTKQLSFGEAAKKAGSSIGEAGLWAVRDKDFGHLVKALMLVRQIDFILKWDDAVRSGRPLDALEENCVHLARQLAAQLEQHWLLE
jgi:hypothetical protein